MLVLGLVVSGALQAQAEPKKCDVDANYVLMANMFEKLDDGSIEFTNPSCVLKEIGDIAPIAMAYTGWPLKEVQAGYYCNLNGFKNVTAIKTECDLRNVALIKQDGTLIDTKEMNTCYFTMIRCSNVNK